jgi:hypothetical protein
VKSGYEEDIFTLFRAKPMSGGRQRVVLQRGKNEGIYIGDDVQVIVVDIIGDRVRLGIKAPRISPNESGGDSLAEQRPGMNAVGEE